MTIIGGARGVGLQRTESDSLTVLKTRNPKPRCRQGQAIFKSSRGEPSLASHLEFLDLIASAKKFHVAAWTEEEFGGEWIHVYVQLSHSAGHLKLSQHCDSRLYPNTK